MRNRVVVFSAIVATLGLLLVGCGSSTESSRSAAAVDTSQANEEVEVESSDVEMGEDSATSEPDASEESSAAEESDDMAGSKLCVRNDSSQTVVVSSGLGATTPQGISPGDERCSENSNPFARDVAGILAVDGKDVMAVSVNNPIVGLGNVKLGKISRGLCLDNNLGRQGMKSVTADDGLLQYQFERLTPFSLGIQQIEFRLVLTDSGAPSSGGSTVSCR